MQKKNLDKLENRLLKLSKKEVKLNNALVQMELVIANQGNISKSNLDNLKNKTKKIESKINTIHTNYNKINLIRSELLKKTDKSEKNFRTGETMRNACKTLGGERVTLTTSDSVKLDSIYLDASRFRNKLADAGCELLTIKQNESGSGLNALFITKENYNQSGKEVFKALEELRAFANPDLTKSDPGAGWQIVHHPYGILIINESELSSIKKHPFIQYNESEGYLEFKQEANKNIEYTRTSIDRELPAAGTAIITSGNAGVYEMHKNEAAFFLLRNMNVMMFNFRGYGESEGTPNQSGMQLDIECAYQFVKARFKDEDKKILFKSLCMSGAFASYMAAKHPQTNIILDQSYSKFNRVIKHQLNTESAYEKIPSFLRKTVAQIMSYLTLDINISKRLQKNEGKIGIIYSHEDQGFLIRKI